jgi:hypothetical protein
MDDAIDVELVALAEPRALSDEERQALKLLAQGPELAVQAESAIVVAECSCGCGSVGLATDGPAMPDTEPAFTIEAKALNTHGNDVQVNLHLVDGLIDELEIWTGFYGERVPLDTSTFRADISRL